SRSFATTEGSTCAAASKARRSRPQSSAFIMAHFHPNEARVLRLRTRFSPEEQGDDCKAIRDCGGRPAARPWRFMLLLFEKRQHFGFHRGDRRERSWRNGPRPLRGAHRAGARQVLRRGPRSAQRREEVT